MTEQRSRKGCVNCKKLRRKCSEELPRCKGCVRRGISCEYPVRLQWAEVGFGAKAAPRRRSQRQKGSLQSKREASSTVELPDHTSKDLPDLLDVDNGFDGIPQQSMLRGQGDTAQAYHYVGHEVGLDDSSQSTTLDTQHKDLEQNAWRSLIISNLEHSHFDLPEVIPFDTLDEILPDDAGWTLEDCSWDDTDSEVFSSLGERIAFEYWLNSLSSRISAQDTEQNPYRRLATMGKSSPVLLHTIIALATEYMHLYGRMAPEIVMKRHQKATTLLCAALQPSQCVLRAAGELNNDESILAAVLMQITNVIFTGGPGVEAHLSCARYFMQQLGYFDQPQDKFFPRLMVQRYTMLDVTIAILRHRRPYFPVDFWFMKTDENYDQTYPSFREMTGCSHYVLVLFAKIAFLADDLQKVRTDDAHIIDEAMVLEMEMRTYAESWNERHKNRVASHLDTLSQCFYWAAHLVLQRTVFGDLSQSRRVQHTVTILCDLIKSMPLGCGPDSSLSFPFYIVCKELISHEQRDWARNHNCKLQRVYPGQSRSTLMAILEEIWTTMDNAVTAAGAHGVNLDEKLAAVERTHDFCIL